MLIGLLAFFALAGLRDSDRSTAVTSGLPSLALTLPSVPKAATRLGALQQIELDGGGIDADYTTITPADVDGNLLVATGTDPQQGRTVLTIDLKTGDIARLTDFNKPKVMHSLNISEEYVVWVEEENGADSPAELHIVNLPDGSETHLTHGSFSQVDLQDGIVVWQGVVDEVRGLYGYDIYAGQPFVIDQSAYAHLPKLPRVCNEEWMIYLISPTGALPHLAELVAYNRHTEERITLDELPITTDPNSANQHACDEELIAWAAPRFEEVDGKALGVNEVHLFDLTARSARVLDGDAPFASKVLMSDDVILLPGFHNIGYDLENDRRFDANTAELPHEGVGFSVLLTDGQLVWIGDPDATDPAEFHITTIERER